MSTMKQKGLRALKTIGIGLALLYVVMIAINLGDDPLTEATTMNTSSYGTVAILGATGTIGDGLLKAAIDDANIEKIHVITRRPSPRIEAGVELGKVVMTVHKDYLDYAAIGDVLAEVDTVYWAIGLSSAGLDQETYREIHLDFPTRFLTEWLNANPDGDRSFHYVSGAGASADSRMMWAREKAHAESALASLAEEGGLRVVSYRPSIILPTEAEAHLGHRVLYAIAAPLKAAVAAEAIGEAMLSVTARDPQLPNGTVLENRQILALAEAYGTHRAARPADNGRSTRN